MGPYIRQPAENFISKIISSDFDMDAAKYIYPAR
jgi:hypothetical protein